MHEDRFLDAETIAKDDKLNPDGASSRTIRNMLEDEGLKARIPARLLDISKKNKIARIKWCKARENWKVREWKKIVFTDESYLCAKQFRIRWVRRYDGEDLGPEYCTKKISTNS